MESVAVLVPIAEGLKVMLTEVDPPAAIELEGVAVTEKSETWVPLIVTYGELPVRERVPLPELAIVKDADEIARRIVGDIRTFLPLPRDLATV